MNITRDELKKHLRKQDEQPRTIRIDKYEAAIICAAILSLTMALVSDHLSEVAFVGLIGTFFGYTFGRIFNHVQGKE